MKVLLLSGGLESTAIAYGEKPDVCLTVSYGQPAVNGEIQAARAICKKLGRRHKVLHTDAYDLRAHSQLEDRSWWPFRNQLLISLTAAHFGTREEVRIFIGLVKDDIYKDCSAEFVATINQLLGAQETRALVIAPGHNLTTMQLLHKYKVPYALLGLTLSCHTGPMACGQCKGCTKSKQAIRIYKNRSKISLVDF